jgi:CheY-like chemotaxis protein
VAVRLPVLVDVERSARPPVAESTVEPAGTLTYRTAKADAMTTGTVLCVDPDADDRARTAQALEGADFDVATAAGADDAPDLAGFDAVVTEYDLPDGTGLDLLATVRSVAPDATCVVFTDADLGSIDTSRVSGLIVESLSKTSPNARDRLVDLLAFAVEATPQTSYPIPQDESDRLATLASFDLEDAGVQAAFDRLTALARRQFDAPMASINVIDSDEQWTVSCDGGDLGTMDREQSVCTFTILEGEPVAIADLHEDPRFEGVETIRESPIRAYAGAPLEAPTADGSESSSIGSFCVYAFEPRSFDDEMLGVLESFAAEAVEQLVLRRRISAAESVAVPGAAGDADAVPTDADADTDADAEDDAAPSTDEGEREVEVEEATTDGGNAAASRPNGDGDGDGEGVAADPDADDATGGARR